MRGCEEYIKILSAISDNEASPPEKDAALAHIETCESCRRVFETFAGISDILSEEAELPDLFAPRVMLKIRRRAPVRKKRFKIAVRFVSGAACLALLVYGAARFGFFPDPRSTGGGMLQRSDQSASSDNAAPEAAGGGTIAAGGAAVADANTQPAVPVPEYAGGAEAPQAEPFPADIGGTGSGISEYESGDADIAEEAPQITADGAVGESAVAAEPEDGRSAYDSAIENTDPYSSFEVTDYSVLQMIETDYCTVFLADAGGLSQRVCMLFLVYKPGSAQGEGETVRLPLQANGGGGTYKPDELWLSEDGSTLYYSYHFGERETDANGRVLHETGTYIYSVDLRVASVSREFTEISEKR